MTLLPCLFSAKTELDSVFKLDKNTSIPAITSDQQKSKDTDKKSALPSDKKKNTVNWLDNIDTAFAQAANQFRPILILFSSPDCPWCVKLKNTTLKDNEVLNLLSEFISVEINVIQDRKTPALFSITGLPVIVITNSNGKELLRTEGYCNKQNLLSMFNAVLNKKTIASKKTEMSKLLYLLKDKKMKKENWRELMNSLGKYPNYSNEVFSLIRNYKNLPAEIFVELLSDTTLTVRLGALEVLEELTGNDFNFDPWHPSKESNFKAIEKWKSWSEEKKLSDKAFVSFSKKQCMDLISQALSTGNPMRAVRARHLLRRAGKAAFDVLNDYINQHKNLPESQIRKIKELQYSLCIPDSYPKDPGTLAHKIIFGKLDSKLNAIEELRVIGKSVLPIIKDLLNDNNPLIRETAVDFLPILSAKSCIELIRKILKNEKDEDVIFAILRTLSHYEKSDDAQKLLATYLKSKNEDLIIAALNGLSKGKYQLSKKIQHKLMTDSRWRVKVAVVNYIYKTNNSNGIDDLMKLVNDKDQFVKTKVILTLAKVSPANALKVLEKIFINDDSMKSTVIKAYVSMEKEIPKKIIAELKKCDYKTLLDLASMIVAEKNKILLPIAEILVKKDNLDLRIPALKFFALSLSQTSPSKDIKIISDALVKNNEKEVLSIVKYLNLQQNNSIAANLFLDEDTNDPELEELLSAFNDDSNEHQPKPPTTENSSNKADITNLFDAFEGTSPEKEKSVSFDIIYKELSKIFEQSKNQEIKLFSAGILIATNKEKYNKYLIENFHNEPMEIRLQFLEKIYEAENYKATSDFLFQATKDKNKKVQKYAVKLIFRSKSPKLLLKLMNSIENSEIEPSIIPPWQLSSALDQSNTKIKNKIKSKALSWLKKEKVKPELIILAGTIFSISPYSKAIPYLEKYINSKNKYVRRAVYFARFRYKKIPSAKILEAIQKETDPFVKISFTTAIALKVESSSVMWYCHFDDKHFLKLYMYESSFSNHKLNKKFIAILKNFTNSEDKNLRFKSYLLLLYAHKKVDLIKFYELATSFPDLSGISEQITNFFENNYTSLGENFKILLPLVDKSSYKYEKISKYFKVKSDSNKKIVFAQYDNSKEINAEFISDKNKQSSELKIKKNKLILVFFEKKGCKDCSRVKKLLVKIKNIFRNLKIQKYDIDKVRAMRLNETYCEKFNVPDKYRLIAPALFAGAGYLVKSDITEAKAVKLLANSISVPLDKWYNVSQKEIEKSSERIEKRYEKTNIWLILLAGLLDGVNPCAFATIIFFISYLRIKRKNTREIILVGVSFISAVFLAYLAFGLGLNQVIVKFYKFDLFRIWFNRGMALFVLIIMLMSIYDAILCMKGNIENISLQLPNFIKEKIRSTIRTGSSNTHYIIAAFIMGCVISFLELGCTGQVYAPMIAYMWQTGIDYYGSILYLIVYNLAFILPLVIIFATVIFGLKNETLNNFFHKHAALVKFSTAILFLILLISICYYNPDILKF